MQRHPFDVATLVVGYTYDLHIPPVAHNMGE